MPDDLFGFTVDPKNNSKLVEWSKTMSPFELDTKVAYTEIFIPTKETIRSS